MDMLHHGLRVHCGLTPSRRYACSRSCLRHAVASRALSNSSRNDHKTEGARGPRAAWEGQLASDSVRSRTPMERKAKINSLRHAAFGDWSPTARQLREDIISGRVEAAAHLRSCIAAGNASLETIRACLDAEYKRITRYRRSARPAVLDREDKRFARTMLPYLWEETDFLLALITCDDEARVQLCYFALAEGCENILHDWVTAPLPEKLAHWTNPLEPSTASTLADVRWRSSLIRCTVCAHLMHDTSHSADGAIASFLRIDKVVWAGKNRFRKERRLDPNKPLFYSVESFDPANAHVSELRISHWSLRTNKRQALG